MKTLTIFIATAMLAIGCDSPTDSSRASTGFSGNSGSGGGDWQIPAGEIYDGGPGKDGIPALQNPEMISAGTAGYLSDQDLVIGVQVDDDARAYPHKIMDWHEIVNDAIGDEQIAVTYCPLTGSGIGWDRLVNGQTTTFGVSGLLFNTNLIPYDRATDSNWSQMKLECVQGPLTGTPVKTHQVIETTWGTWKKLAPSTIVVSPNTGFNRNYGRYPYGDYRSNHSSLLFPVSHNDNRLKSKARVLGVIINGLSKAYPITAFNDNITLIKDTIGNTPVLVVGSRALNFAVAFIRDNSDGAASQFTTVQDELPVILRDQEGTRWDVFGRAISGPNQGERLTPARSYIAFWFAWAAFWPETDLHS